MLLLCPANDMTCPYWRWGGRCFLEDAKDVCDEWMGLMDEEEEDEDE